MGTAGTIRINDHIEQFGLVLERLDERQRRWVSGLIAAMMARGGISAVARAAGLDEKTVARGKAELEAGLQGYPTDGRVRRPGGGRPRIEKKRPASNKS